MERMKISVKEFLPPYKEKYEEEEIFSAMSLFERVREIQEDIAKRTLAYAYECWKNGIFYIVNKTECSDFQQTAMGEAIKIKVNLAGIKSKEELDYAIKVGYNVCDFSSWTVEKFKEAGVDV